jgi:hypothetical protein
MRTVSVRQHSTLSELHARSVPTNHNIHLLQSALLPRAAHNSLDLLHCLPAQPDVRPQARNRPFHESACPSAWLNPKHPPDPVAYVHSSHGLLSRNRCTVLLLGQELQTKSIHRLTL